MEDLFYLCGVRKTKKLEREFYESLEGSDEFIIDNNFVYPKDFFLKDIPFRIQPTAYELEHNILVSGHRIIPFQPAGMFPHEVRLLWKEKPIPRKSRRFFMAELEIFVSLLDLIKLPVTNLEDMVDSDVPLNVEVFDLSDFYSSTNFKLGDTIVLRSVFFKGGIFTMEYCSREEYERSIFMIKKNDQFFLEILEDVLCMDLLYPSIEKQLLNAYFCYSVDTSAKERAIPMSALGPLIVSTDDIVFSMLPDGRKVFHFRDESIEDIIYSPMYAEEESDEPEDLNTLDGFLRFIGNNNCAIVVRAIIYDQLIHGAYDPLLIKDYLFHNLPQPYLPRTMDTILHRLLEREHVSVRNNLLEKHQLLPLNIIRKNILAILLSITDFIRKMDEQKIDLDSIPKKDVYGVMQIENAMLDTLEILEDPTEAPNVDFLLRSVKKIDRELPFLISRIEKIVFRS